MKKNVIVGIMIVVCAITAMGRPMESFLGVEFGKKMPDNTPKINGVCDLPTPHNQFRKYDVYFARTTHTSRKIWMIGAIKTFDEDDDLDDVYDEMQASRKAILKRYRHMGITEYGPETECWKVLRGIFSAASQTLAIGRRDLMVFTLKDADGDVSQVITIRAIFDDDENEKSVVVCAEDTKLAMRDELEKKDVARKREAAIGNPGILDDINAL